MLVGSAYMLPRLWRKWKQSAPLSKTIGVWIIISGVLGLYATLPGMLRRLTATGEWATAWWTNIFLFYAMIEKLSLPSIALGELCAASIFATQYALILYSIQRIRKNACGHPEQFRS